MIRAGDGKWRVSVEGQIDMPFDTHEDALEWAAGVNMDGFECVVYYSAPSGLEERKRGENDFI